MHQTRVQFLGGEDPLEKEMATHSSTLCLGDPIDRGAWWAIVSGVIKSQTQLSTCAEHGHLQRQGWSHQVWAEREAELGQRLSWSHGDLGSICWSVRAGAWWPGFCPPAGIHPCTQPRVCVTLNKRLTAALC